MTSTLVIGDWGSSRLRLWLIASGKIVEHREGPGMLSTSNPSSALAKTLTGWPGAPVVLSGMAGARNGLLESAYTHCPASAGQWVSAGAAGEFSGRPLRVAAGIAYRDPDGRPDVMRGEEAQIFGAIELHPALAEREQLVILPGTHSKWVWLKDGEIAGFRTFITGELFQTLKGSSLFSVDEIIDGETDTGFQEGLSRSASQPGLTSSLFEARSAQLCDKKSAGWASGFVSGLLIGAEIAEMAPDGPLTIIGEEHLSARYARALARSGIDVTILNGDQCAIAGLRLLHADA